MILGLLSDTHGQRWRTAAAVNLLQDAGATAFIHCGDVGSQAVLDELAGRRAWVVLGNTDESAEGWEAHGALAREPRDSCGAPLVEYGESLGLVVAPTGPLLVGLDGRVLAIFHGHERALARLLDYARKHHAVPRDLGPCDYVLHGHTHVARDVRVGPLRVINPGALERTATAMVATLDLRSDQVRFWPLVNAQTAR